MNAPTYQLLLRGAMPFRDCVSVSSSTQCLNLQKAMATKQPSSKSAIATSNAFPRLKLFRVSRPQAGD